MGENRQLAELLSGCVKVNIVTDHQYRVRVQIAVLGARLRQPLYLLLFGKNRIALLDFADFAKNRHMRVLSMVILYATACLAQAT